MLPVIVRGYPLPLLVALTMAPSATGVCPALVPEVVALTPDERAATPVTVKRKIASLNAAVLGACP